MGATGRTLLCVAPIRVQAQAAQSLQFGPTKPTAANTSQHNYLESHKRSS